jgi:hypothetical protein
VFYAKDNHSTKPYPFIATYLTVPVLGILNKLNVMPHRNPKQLHQLYQAKSLYHTSARLITMWFKYSGISIYRFSREWRKQTMNMG